MCTLNNKKNTDVEMLMPKIKYNAINKIVFANYDLLDIIFNNINLQNVINQEEYKVYSDIKKYSNLENYEHNRYFNCFSKIIVPITINFSVVSIGLATESKKIEKIILKNKFKNIVIIIANWEILSSEVQDFIIILLKNKEKFIKQYSKNSITIVYGTVDTNDKLKDSFFDNVIIYNNLSIKDSLLLVQQYTEFGDINYKVFEEIFKINIGDFSKILTTLKLTKEHKYALSKNTLDKLLNNMLLEINNKICFKYTNTEKVLQLFSLFPKYFDPYEIVNIDISVDSWELEQNINILEKLFVLFKHELNGNVEYTMLLQLKNKFLYSDEIIKKELFKLYYQYLTEFFPFDFKRKIQVQVNYLKNNDEILYQYILLYDYYFINNMDFNVDFIINEFEKLNMPDINKNLFMNIVSLDYKEKYKMLSEKLYYIKNDKINAFLLKKDIEYYSANNDCNVDLRGLCDLLYELIITKNCFKGDCLMKAIYLMVLIPQYIDKFNDIEKGYFLIEEFNNLDSKSEIVQEHIMYYKNILNRKSYLFVPTDSAILKCKGTLKFFEEKKDDAEIYMTLNTLLSLYIINDELELAKECRTKIIKMYDENLPQFYKSKMNFILLDIISGEYANYEDIISRYIAILNEDITTTSRNIIFTNLCSLALEYDDFKTYEKYKKELEALNNIEDISDITNELVDDFYRYYFAWFEFGKNMICGNKTEAKRIYKSLEKFVPSIFLSESRILNYKYQCFKNILDFDITSGKEFSEFAVGKKNNFRNWKFLSRGFMLTDIQHTSII